MAHMDHGRHMSHHRAGSEATPLDPQSEDAAASSDCAMVSCCGHAMKTVAAFASDPDYSGLIYDITQAASWGDRQPHLQDRPPKHL